MKNNLIKNLAFAFLTLSIGFTACKKDNDYIAELIQKEIDDREAYIEANYPNETPTASGLYYIETEEGTGAQATTGSVVHVYYEGRYLSGGIFDSLWEVDGSPFVFTIDVSNVIQGWHEGIALMKEGGRARLIIPSDLAYGANGYGSIPSYTTLVFDVKLVDVE